MEYGQDINNNEDNNNDTEKKYTNEKLDQLTLLVQGLTENLEKQESKKVVESDDVLKRIEDKLDILAESSSGEYIDLFLSRLKDEIEEKQKYLNDKINYIEKLNSYIANLLKNRPKELTTDTALITEGFSSIKSTVEELKDRFITIQKNLGFLNEKLIESPEGVITLTTPSGGISKEDVVNFVSELKPLLEKQETKFDSTFLFLNEKIDQIRKLIGSLNQDNKDLMGQITASTHNIKSQIDNVSNSVSDVDKKVSSFYETMEKISLSSSNIGNISSKIDSLYNTLSNLPLNFAQENLSQTDFLEITNSLDAIKHSIYQVKTSVESGSTKDLAKKIENIIEKLNKLPEIFAVLMDVLKESNVKTEVQEIKKSIESLKNISLEDISSVNIDLSPFLEKLNQINENIEKVNTDKNSELLLEIKNIIENLKPENNISDEISKISEKIEALSFQNKTLESVNELEEVKNTLNNINNNISSHFQAENIEQLRENLFLVLEKLNLLPQTLQEVCSNIDFEYLKSASDLIKQNLENFIQSESTLHLKENLENILEKLQNISNSSISYQQVDELKSHIYNAKDEIIQAQNFNDINLIKESINNLSQKIELISSHVPSLEDNVKLDSISVAVDAIEISSNDIKHEINDVKEKLNKLDDIIISKTENIDKDTFYNVINNLESNLTNILNSQNTDFIQNDVSILVTKIDYIKSIVENSSSSLIIEEVKNSLGDLKENLDQALLKIDLSSSQDYDLNEELKQNLVEVKNEFLAAFNNLKELIESNKNININNEIQNLNEKINHIIESQIKSSAITELHEKLEKTYSNIAELISAPDNQTVIDEISKTQEGIHFVSENINDIKLNLDRINNIIDIKVSEEQNEEFNEKLDEIKNSIFPVYDKLNHLIENQENIITPQDIENIKELISPLYEKINHIIDSQSDSFGEFIEVKNKLEDLSSNLLSAPDNLTVIDEISKTQEGINYVSENINDIKLNLDRINNFIDIKSSEEQNEEFNEKLDEIKNSIFPVYDKLNHLFENQENIITPHDIENIKELISPLYEKINHIIDSQSDSFGGFSELNKKIEDLSINLENVLNVHSEESLKLNENIENSKNIIVSSLYEISNNNLEALSDKATINDINELKSYLKTLNNVLEDLVSSQSSEEISEPIITEIQKIQDIIIQNIDDIKPDILLQLKENIENIRSSIINSNIEALEIIEEKLSNVFSSIQNIEISIQENFEQTLKRMESKLDVMAETDITDNLEFLISELKKDLQEKYYNLNENINLLSNAPENDELILNLNQIKEQIYFLQEHIKSINFEEKINESLNIFIDEIKPVFSKANSIEEHLLSFIKEQDEKTQSILNFIVNSSSEIQDKFNKIEDISNAIHNLENISHETSSDLQDKFNKIEDISNAIHNLENISHEASSNLQDKFNKIEDISNAIHNLENISHEASSNLENKIEELKDFSEQIDIKIQKIDLNELKDNLKSFQDNVECFLNSENSDYIKSNISNILEKLDTLNSITLDNANASDLEEVRVLIEELSENLSYSNKSNIDEINQSVTAVKEKLEAVLEILVINASTEDIENLKEQININKQSIDNISNNIETTIKENISGLIINLSNFEDKLNESISFVDQGLTNVNDSLNQDMELLKIEIGLFTKKVSEIEESLFKNISNPISSKVEESKDIILERVHELNNYILELSSKLPEIENNFSLSLNEIIDNIDSTTGTIINSLESSEFKTDNISNKVDDIDIGLIQLNGNIELLNEKIENFSKEYENILTNIEFIPEISQNLSELSQSSLESSVSLSKINNILGEAQNGLKNDNEKIENNFITLKTDFQNIAEKFNKFQEDITDISNRTNKLIITSSDDSDLLKENLSLFKENIENLNEKTSSNIDKLQNTINKNFEVPSSEIKNLLKENISLTLSNQKTLSALPSSVKSTEEIKNAIIHMAEWIDGAAKIIEQTNSETFNISKKIKNDEILEVAWAIKDAIKNLNEKIETNSSDSKQNIEILRNVIQNINNSVIPITEEIKRENRNEFEAVKQAITKISSNQPADEFKSSFSQISGEISNISILLNNFENRVKNDLNRITADIETQETAGLKTLKSLDLHFAQTKQEINIEISKLNDKFNIFESKFDRLEQKIENLSNQQPNVSNDEIKTILEYIAGQVTASNEGGKWKALVAKKLDNLDKKISGFEESIKKIDQFWEE